MAKKDKEKITVGIYQIDLSLFIDDSFEGVVKEIIKSANVEGKRFEPDKLSSTSYGNHNLRIYYKKRSSPPRWAGFLKKILAHDAVLQTSCNTNHDFLLFIEYESRTFVIAGGTGSVVINRYVVSSFGIDILCRLIQANSQVIKSIQERGVTGIVLGQTRFYRDDQRLIDENQFGKIYKEVKAELDGRILKSVFGFKDTDLKKKAAGCLAKSSFQLNKLLGIDELLRVIERISIVLDKSPNFTINNVQAIAGRSDDVKRLKANLLEELVKVLYGHYLNETQPDFDFCHKNFEEFLSAPYYRIPNDNTPHDFKEQPNLKDVFKVLKKMKGENVKDEYLFKQFILWTSSLEAFDTNGIIVTEDSIINHIHGEISYNGNTYFLIDGIWYKINNEFVVQLNHECQNIFADAWDDKLISIPFDHQTEREFNECFVGQANTLVFDTITAEKIEGCDILMYNDTSLFLVHVKQGFDNSIRDLAGQIAISARRIAQDRLSGYKYLNDLEINTINGKVSNSPYRKKLGNQAFPKDGLKSLFIGKREINICFCLAFVDTAKDERCLKNDTGKFTSNIAKYSLIDARKGVKQYGFDFKVIQLRRNK